MTLSDAMAAARAGRREEARALLMRVLETDERNAQAWLWLSGVVDDPEEMRVCLDNVLHLEPSNPHALKGIAILDQKYGRPQAREVGQPADAPAAPAEAAAPATPAPAAEVAAPAAEVATPAAPPSEPMAAPAVADVEVARPAPAAPVAGDAAPCPCCGAMMPLKLRRCTQCSRPMLLHTPPNPEEGSRSLTLLAFLWVLPVIIAFVFVIFLWGPIMNSRVDLLLDGASRIIVLIILSVISLPAILIARGLFLRRRWAFIVAVILLGLNTLGFLQRVVEFVIMVAQSDDIQMLTSSTMIMVLMLVVLVISFLWISFQGFLLYRGYPKVFGSKVRFVHTVGAGTAAEHYNTGIALKEQGMWYAAMQEWEAAAYGDAANVQYLHALGLAYAQVKQRAKAISTLEHAITLAPNDQRLRETYQMVQTLA
ncbi:hypothetical protein F8S13_08145 [Chloroflexia bacterium SDU3-3]|nr:hypothetical protein F8S13_08145 [Chloroflexia bacterium SDU3-3]